MADAGYIGPKYHLIRSLDDFAHEVIDHLGNRIGVYPNHDMAARVRDDSDRVAMRAYLREQATARRADRKAGRS